MAVAVGLVLIFGDFDISVGSQISLVGAVMAIRMTRTGQRSPGRRCGCHAGAALGAVNGLIVAKSKTPSFIMTLGTLSAYHGVVLSVTQGGTTSIERGCSRLWAAASSASSPSPSLLFFLVLLVACLLMRYTRFGRSLFAIGGNPKAAYLSGVNDEVPEISVYTLCGGLVALASMTLISKLGASSPNTGDGYEMDSLAAIVVGGTSLAGGKGSALGLFLGVIIFGLMSNSLNIMNVSPYFRDVFIGGIIIVATVFSRFGEGKK